MALYYCTVVLFLGFCTAEFTNRGGETYFFQDYLTPYSEIRHGSGRRVAREIADCQHVKWDNRTFEELLVPRPSEVSSREAQVSINVYIISTVPSVVYESVPHFNSL